MTQRIVIPALLVSLLVGCAVKTPLGDDDPDAGAADSGASEDGGECERACGAECCAPGQACVDGACEAADAGRCRILCGPSYQCCGGEEECVGDRCLPACAGTRCGADDELCCTAGELCINGACEPPGGPCVTDPDCPTGAACEPLLGRCLPTPEGTECRYIPPPDEFEPLLEWELTETDGVRSHPIVTQLDDDDGDGAITPRDVPDIVFHGGRLFAGPIFDFRMFAVSGDGSGIHWHSEDGYKVCPASVPAAGDLDGDGTVEIVTLVAEASEPGACNGNRIGTTEPVPIHVAVYDHRGRIEWVSTLRVNSTASGAEGNQPVTIADLDSDGDGEIIANGFVFDHTGTHLWTGPGLAVRRTGWGVGATVADIDGDGFQEVFGPAVAYRYDGSEIWQGGPVSQGGTAIGNVVPSVPGPQLVVTGARSYVVRDAATGATILGPLDSGPGGARIPHPVIADFDGDGQSELGVSTNYHFAIVDPGDVVDPPHVRWSVTTAPAVGRVGVTVFDFDGDGQSEVILSSYCHVRVLDGRDGRLLWQTTNTATNASQYAIVADVDGDFNAELVTMSDFGLGSSGGLCASADLPFEANVPGLRVWGDRLDNWVATRRAWNQISYHLDNVFDDGTLSSTPEPRWSTHNTYRVNQFPDPTTATLSPNLTIVAIDADLAGCPDRLVIKARIQNEGARGVGAGVQVAFYAGEPGAGAVLLGVTSTDEMLLPGDGAWVEVTVAEPAIAADGTINVRAVADDDGAGAGAHSECDETDNGTGVATIDCSGLI